jgi:4'-phosphopantetheinyl transferase EntD
MEHWTDKLVEMKACPDAVRWAKQYITAEAAWEACERPNWMLRVAGKLAETLEDRQALALATAACARTVLKYVMPYAMPVGEDPPPAAIEAVEAWAAEAWATSHNQENADAVYTAARAAQAAARSAMRREMAGIVRSYIGLYMNRNNYKLMPKL